MEKYNEKLILGKSIFSLDDTQRDFLRFEEDASREKYLKYLEVAKSEAAMQYFFESNPAFLPGLYDKHNGPLGQVVISKLKLGNDFVTDFAFLSINSAEAQITFIEIESPLAHVFREKDDLFSSSFNRAYQQVRDWGLWADQNATYLKDIFRSTYYRNVFRYQKVTFQRILVVGRRSEIQSSPQREKRWASVNHDPFIAVMSYDRLADNFSLNPTVLKKLTCCPARYIASLLKRHYL